MSYYGIQGLYSSKPKYVAPDGSIVDPIIGQSVVAYHDACAPAHIRGPVGNEHGPHGFSWTPYESGFVCSECGERS